VDWLLEALEPFERDAIRGDLVERGEGALLALWDAFDIVLRRQADLFRDWRALAVVLPVAFIALLLSIAARRTSDGTAVYMWMYANNWRSADLLNRGFWYLLAGSAEIVLIDYLSLASGAWAGGFLLGSVARGLTR